MQKSFLIKRYDIDKEWRNGGTNRLVQAEHTFCLTALTSKACVAGVNKEDLERNCFQPRAWNRLAQVRSADLFFFRLLAAEEQLTLIQEKPWLRNAALLVFSYLELPKYEKFVLNNIMIILYYKVMGVTSYDVIPQ